VGDGANRVRAGVDGRAVVMFWSFAVFVLEEMVRRDKRKRMRHERHV
jgi:uncharacterized membrane protein